MKEFVMGFGYFFNWIITMLITLKFTPFDDYMGDCGWRLIDVDLMGRHYIKKA